MSDATPGRDLTAELDELKRKSKELFDQAAALAKKLDELEASRESASDSAASDHSEKPRA